MKNATERFTGRAEQYAKYRETYDAELVLSRLRSWAGLDPAWRIADIGAGTGMLSDVFLANGNHVIAVEPNLEMREAFLAEHPQCEATAAGAEATGLPDASVDAIAVGRALHWFDYDRAMEEFRRILKPGGWVFVLAVGRDDAGREENQAFHELLGRHAGGGETVREGYALYRRLPETFKEGAFHHEVVRDAVELSWESFRGQATSLSYAPLPTSPSFVSFERELHALFERFAVAGRITLATRHWINAGRW